MTIATTIPNKTHGTDVDVYRRKRHVINADVISLLGTLRRGLT